MQIFIILAIIVGGFAAYISMQPDGFRVTRQLKMSAPKEKIFAQVNDLRAWDAWSPWAKLDPNAKNSFEGSPAGTGAVMRWKGNAKVGAGSMTITESRPNEFIRFRLDFLRPMRATNIAEFTFQPDGNQTNVTWNMTGKNSLVGKAMSLFFSCEKMVGGQFEKGLTQLKAIVENGSR